MLTSKNKEVAYSISREQKMTEIANLQNHRSDTDEITKGGRIVIVLNRWGLIYPGLCQLGRARARRQK